VDATRNTVYVVNAGTPPGKGTVSVINGATGVVTSTITVGFGSPYGIAVDATRNTVYVANVGGSVSVINGAGTPPAVTSTITVGPAPFGVAVNATTNTVYATNFGNGTVSVINGAGTPPAVISTITVGRNPVGVAVNEANNTVYVANTSSVSDGNSVSVIDGATGVVADTIPVGSYPLGGVAVNATTNTVYVANTISSSVSVLSVPVAPSITTDTLPAATVGTPYSATVTATGTGPITFAVSSGALPGGLVLGSSTGVVSGTPTSAGSATFTLTATNSAGTNSKTYTVAVAAAAVSASSSTVVASPISVTADGSATSTITVTLLDASSNPVSGKTVTLAKSSGPGSPIISAASGPSDGSGVVTFTVKSTTAGADAFAATDADDSLVITPTATVTFISAGALDHITLSPSSATITAGGSQSYIATGFAADGNSWDATPSITFTIDGGGSCNGALCTATVAGDHIVTGTDTVGGTIRATATLHVDAARATPTPTPMPTSTPLPSRVATPPPTSTGVGPASDGPTGTILFLPVALVAFFGSLLLLVIRQRRQVF
jgi:YVTN family beta-propeller protein